MPITGWKRHGPKGVHMKVGETMKRWCSIVSTLNFKWLIGLLSCPLLNAGAVADPQVVRDIRYGDRHEQQCLDLYLPSGGTPDSSFPCLVFIHGGGWSTGDKKTVENLPVSELLAAGYAVASINYELSSRTNRCWPRNLDDCRQAVRYLREQAKDYSLDPDRFVLAGASAGGHLALMTAYTWDAPGSIRGVVAFFPVCDLTRIMMAHPSAHWGDPFMPQSFADHPELYAQGSPINHVGRNVPPTLVFHGTADNIVEFELHSQVLVERLRDVGVESRLVKVEGAGHSLLWGTRTAEVTQGILGFMSERVGVMSEK